MKISQYNHKGDLVNVVFKQPGGLGSLGVSGVRLSAIPPPMNKRWS